MEAVAPFAEHGAIDVRQPHLASWARFVQKQAGHVRCSTGDIQQPVARSDCRQFDGKIARFNLNGVDFTAKELSQWLSKINSPLAVIDCSASSGPFLAELSGPHRVVITATRTGSERNFAHFGDFLSSAIADTSADLDKDDQTSLFEAYLKANSQLREFYAEAGRLTTEHALLDDNGDRQGTPADWFQGLRPTKSARSPPRSGVR